MKCLENLQFLDDKSYFYSSIDYITYSSSSKTKAPICILAVNLQVFPADRALVIDDQSQFGPDQTETCSVFLRETPGQL